MKITKLIQILAETCNYNKGEVYLHIDGKNLPLRNCLDQFVHNEDGSSKRVLVLTADNKYLGN